MIQMKRFYDSGNKRLIYVGDAATEQFLDSHAIMKSSKSSIQPDIPLISTPQTPY